MSLPTNGPGELLQFDSDGKLQASLSLGGRLFEDGYFSGTPAQKGVAAEVWIAVRTDGVGGAGTAEDPFDGSTQAKFDALMAGFGTYTAIHLLPGTFLTAGWGDGSGATGWLLQEGQKIAGAGAGVTTVKLNSLGASARHLIIAGGATAQTDNVTVSDLTIDGNAPGLSLPTGECIDGIRLSGNYCTIRNVEVVNAKAFTGDISYLEGFAISIGTKGTDDAPDIVGALIENCHLHDSTGFISGISILKATGDDPVASGIIRGCLVEDLTDWTAYNFQGNGLVISGNFATNCEFGIRCDTGNTSNVLIAHNVFKATQLPIQFIPDTGTCSNVIIDGNYLENSGDSLPVLWLGSYPDLLGPFPHWRVSNNLFNSTGDGGYSLSVNASITYAWIDGNISNVESGADGGHISLDASSRIGANYWGSFSPDPYYTNADNLSSGTIPDARLSANVPRLDAANTFTGNQALNGAGLSQAGSFDVADYPSGVVTSIPSLNYSADGQFAWGYYLQNLIGGNYSVAGLGNFYINANIGQASFADIAANIVSSFYLHDSAAIPRALNLYIQSPGTDGTTTATKAYGVYIDQQKLGSGTGYGIWQGASADFNVFAGNVAIGSTTDPTQALNVSGNAAVTGFVQVGSNPPASASAAGSAGQITWDTDYLYVCVGTNTWKRAALASW